MQDISGFGFRLNLVALNSFPRGFELSAFADDSDPFDIPELVIAEAVMGLNGDLITWKNANPIAVTVSIIPGSRDDINLAFLAEANRAGKGKLSVNDVINIAGVLPNGKTIAATNGIVNAYPPGDSITSAGRLKSKAYKFIFENILVVPVQL